MNSLSMLLKSSCRLELLIARLADRKLNLSFRSIARSFDRGSVVITMVESIG